MKTPEIPPPQTYFLETPLLFCDLPILPALPLCLLLPPSPLLTHIYSSSSSYPSPSDWYSSSIFSSYTSTSVSASHACLTNPVPVMAQAYEMMTIARTLEHLDRPGELHSLTTNLSRQWDVWRHSIYMYALSTTWRRVWMNYMYNIIWNFFRLTFSVYTLRIFLPVCELTLWYHQPLTNGLKQ